jgi:ATP diphosphatase
MSYANQIAQQPLGMARKTACAAGPFAGQIGYMTPRIKPSREIARLIEIMAALRTPETGCPWDLKQDFAMIAPYTIEEACEVADAIARGDLDDLKDELGDLLLQVVFHARMAQEQGAFAFGDVVQAITEKLIRRHPHVFGDTADLTPDQVKGLWDRIKAEEKAERRSRRGEAAEAGALAGVPASLPAAMRALKLQQKASKVGFDWNDPKAVLAKIREEADEIEAALDAKDKDAAAGEIGDLMFALVNLARHLEVDPDAALRSTNLKFERRFAAIEAALSRVGKTPSEATLAEMDALWDQAKAAERGADAQDTGIAPAKRART